MKLTEKQKSCPYCHPGSKVNAEKWTDEELRSLSQWFPQKAIDAMKEPVEDE